ncbi:hypothetical protein ACVNS2_17965 [Paenibacillus caseinilyticus]|uniref:Uncharacterized protein n=1 Tax=Paenibacillus mucilaginosus K02 TaxID=997761 RepID=I0BJI9_9BACL|nr:hypothetical protein [Paenibacillus mucilaginosus]AFH62536.2 hypothetical protein B2K_17710 [Paenibacillus mucilaginosus K02]
MSNYRLTVGEYSLIWGTPIRLDPAPAAGNALTRQPGGEWDWDLPEGVYLARDLVRELAVLLDSVVEQLGGSAGYQPLLDNVKASLALSGRESVLQLDSLRLADPARTELAGQARRIGDTLARWAGEQAGEGPRADKAILGRVRFRSRCDHHLWTPLVTDILTGSSGGPSVMQLFNEYLHQLVLLRDLLLPYENWEEVPIGIERRGKGKGLRYTEQARAAFLAEFLMSRPSHLSLLGYSQSGLAPELSAPGYGFQYRYGTILPASLGRHPADSRRFLLGWYPVRTVPHTVDVGASAVFDYVYPDYYSAPRSHADAGAAASRTHEGDLREIREALLEVTPAEGETARVQIHYRLQIGSQAYRVDLGQLLRGHRYLYLAGPNQPSEEGTRLTAAAVLAQPGLVHTGSGTHHISAGNNPLVVWALLGKLYPENVILLHGEVNEKLQGAGGSGKGFGAKFVIF